MPGWLALLFGFGPALTCGLIVWLRHPAGNSEVLGAILSIVFYLFCGIPMVGGLTLAAQFFDGFTARFLGGIALGLLIVVLIGAVIYAGCMCSNMMSGHTGSI